MPWLTYDQGEVSHFHPEFKTAANEALKIAGLETQYEWIHHLHTPGNTVVPDFVLRRKNSNQWVLAFEIKRTKDAVYSTRYQMQAKSYAESNQNLYSPTSPKYFAISNLEVTMLFAINGDRPPIECRLTNGIFESGDFCRDMSEMHKQQFIDDLVVICNTVVQTNSPSFDLVWPSVLSEYNSFSTATFTDSSILYPEPNSPNWEIIRDYFGSNITTDSMRLFFFRCLMAEYLRGILIKHGHPRATSIPPLQAFPLNRIKVSVANTIDNLRLIDFNSIFEDFSSAQYRQLSDPYLTKLLEEYVCSITTPPRKIVDLVLTRIDYPELLESLLDMIYPISVQDNCGKVQTDHELADILATLTIDDHAKRIVDPCCGDGILLSAAYNRITKLGFTPIQSLSSITGIEADAIAVRIAYLRLALKEPAMLKPNPPISIFQGDMFAQLTIINNCDIVLMNPPFKRYEAQDGRPIPNEIKQYYSAAIEGIDGLAAKTTGNQANLFNYYFEYVTKAINYGTRIGIILDNKWYHNRYGESLRKLILDNFEIEGIVEYPHSIFFAGLTIATSILVAKKVANINANNKVKFIKSKVDPRGVDLDILSNAFHNNGIWPTDWVCHIKSQNELNSKIGWKIYFSNDLTYDFRRGLPNLKDLFEHARRGSLNKEEGGIGVFELPFGLNNFGPKRQRVNVANPRSFQTLKGENLTKLENQQLKHLVGLIPDEFRGYAIRNSFDLEHYELHETDVMKEQTIEPPSLRGNPIFNVNNRTPWTVEHDKALQELQGNPKVNSYIDGISAIVGLNETLLPKDKLWIGLREPYAGELIIPRKMRSGHRVHINPFSFNQADRQVRISSNFFTYKNCQAIDIESGLDRETSTRLIAAYLVSSFGQLQFEMSGYNREGLLSLEQTQLDSIKVLDPRLIRPEKRQQLLDSFRLLPYPILSDRLSVSQTERNRLDELFAEELCNIQGYELTSILNEVHSALDEWIIGRQP
ncbi:putative methyltransferase [Oscillibacter valericigenes Sjm18-20]|nr:putative methyltransferase [Oscillibacter valericigenes Sjm18-20]